MANNGRTKADLLEAMTKIRVKNNDLWMNILAIALEANPNATKEIINLIAQNDAKVVHKLRGLADAADDADKAL